MVGSNSQDLGIWAYRTIGKQSINAGSMVDFAKAVLEENDEKADENTTALVIANPGQLYFHCGSGTAMSHRTWFALPKPSAVHPPLKWTLRNRIPQNADSEEHVQCVFEGILAARGELVSEDAKIDVVAVSDGAAHVTRYLAANCTLPFSYFLFCFVLFYIMLTATGEQWKDFISGMCLADPLHNKSELVRETEIGMDVGHKTGSFERFLSTRCRAYILSPHPLEWPVPGTLQYGCNTFSSGESVYAETSIVSCWEKMLEWLDKLYADPSYEEVELVIAEEKLDDDWNDSGETPAAAVADNEFLINEQQE